MGDLISRSIVIEELYKRISGDLTVEDVKYIEKVIEGVPGAYDVDNVVGRLESQKSGLTTWAEDEAYKLGIEKAIEIVKSGGIE